jgi:aspartate carbamoyltransferase catalytic subunit
MTQQTQSPVTATTRTAFPGHAVSSGEWDSEQLLALFARADWMSVQPRSRLTATAPEAIVGMLFYQNSTRTRISFQTAACLLGAKYVGFASAATTRAGDFFQESLTDTVRVIGGYADLLVLRHVDDDAAERAAGVSPVPVVNAGTGESDHPTQGMLDVWMMTRTLGTIAGRRIGFIGDPGCRAIKAILTMAGNFSPAEVVFLTPENACVLPEQRDRLRELNIACTTVDSAADLIRRVDVTSVIPFELPDFHVPAANAKRSDTVPERFKLTRRLLESPAGRETVVLHCGPRGDELPPEVDDLPNVKYFDAVHAGVYLRAALMDMLWTQHAATSGGLLNK